MIIFLDCDGVLNHSEMDWFDSENGVLPYVADPTCVLRLRQLVEELNARIVISSTWRLRNEREDIVEILGDWIDQYLHDDWRTTRVYDRLRGNQVIDWLNRNGWQPHVILDDDSDFHKWQPLVKTSFSTGLSSKDIEECRKYLTTASWHTDGQRLK